MKEEAHFVTRCLECETLNIPDRNMCSNCGILLYNPEQFCSNCLKLIKPNDERCFSCGMNLKEKEEDWKIEEYHKFERAEKEAFLEEFKSKSYGWDFEYFRMDIEDRVIYYPTVKLLLSEECPEKLANFFDMDHNLEVPDRFGQFAKKFLKVHGTIFFAEKYAQMVTSMIAFLWLRLDFINLSRDKRILIILKAENKHHEFS